jgi:dipeptidyl aminopeptidase/acylaminoacyl peptidase
MSNKKSNNIHLIDPLPLKSVSQTQISPNGENILFTKTELNKKEDRFERHIWIMNTKDETPKQFTQCQVNDHSPCWSPDGSMILFLSNRSGPEKQDERENTYLWIIKISGGEANPIGFIPGRITKTPIWSPDGKNILVLSDVRVHQKDVSKDYRVIRRLSYKKDGVGIIHDIRSQLFVIDSETGRVTQLTTEDYDSVSPCWSPDGGKIAFFTNMNKDEECTPIKDIWVIPVDGGDPEMIKSEIVTRNPSLSWSPDGVNIAYLSEDPYRDEYRYPNIWVLDIDTKFTQNISAGFDRPIDPNLVWSTYSNALLFTALDHSCRRLFRIDIQGSDIQVLTNEKMNVQDFNLSDSGLVFTAASEDSLPEAWIYNTIGNKRLTNFSDNLLKNIEVITPEEFWFKASDGVKVQGWIIKPVKAVDGKKYPTILQIHGGRWGNYLLGFNLLFQILSNNGFAVVTLNHRGSMGYGESFTDWRGDSKSGYPGRAYSDIMECMDYVTNNYNYVDPDKLGVTGCSAGGYLTNWVYTHTDRFKAAIPVASICNWYSMYGCSDNGPCSIIAQDLAKGKAPWEAPDIYLDASPISYVNEVKTPVLIVHGENDLRCPIEQAEQLFSALKKLGKTVEFARFPGEPHVNIHRMKKPNHTKKALELTLNWFNKYLKTGKASH